MMRFGDASQLVFDDLLERAKEKEEKEARKQTRHTEKLMDMLRSFKVLSLFGLIVNNYM